VQGGADFVYSDFAEFNDADHSPRMYSSAFGWTYRAAKGPDGKTYQAAHAPPAQTPWMLQLTHSPNHVRAWTAASYREVGGHNAALEVGDDYDILMRTYCAGKKFVHIPECLYFYRVTGANTHIERNRLIQEVVAQTYDRYCYAAIGCWCRDKELLAIDLGSAHNKPNGY